MSREDERRFGTADLARATDIEHQREPLNGHEAQPEMAAPSMPQASTPGQGEPLAALFQGPHADEFRRRWDAIQIAFVDDPRAAVRNADELVAQVLRTLAESFADQRSQIEAGLGGGEQGNTENMRLALHRYRSFFQRLLSL